MTPEEVLALAREGHPKVIATIMNRSTEAHGIHVRVARKGRCLYVLMEGQAIANHELMKSFVQGSFEKLRIRPDLSVKIYGRKPESDSVAWSDTFEMAVVYGTKPSPLAAAEGAVADRLVADDSTVDRSVATNLADEPHARSVDKAQEQQSQTHHQVRDLSTGTDELSSVDSDDRQRDSVLYESEAGMSTSEFTPQPQTSPQTSPFIESVMESELEVETAPDAIAPNSASEVADASASEESDRVDEAVAEDSTSTDSVPPDSAPPDLSQSSPLVPETPQLGTPQLGTPHVGFPEPSLLEEAPVAASPEVSAPEALTPEPPSSEGAIPNTPISEESTFEESTFEGSTAGPDLPEESIAEEATGVPPAQPTATSSNADDDSQSEDFWAVDAVAAEANSQAQPALGFEPTSMPSDPSPDSGDRSEVAALGADEVETISSEDDSSATDDPWTSPVESTAGVTPPAFSSSSFEELDDDARSQPQMDAVVDAMLNDEPLLATDSSMTDPTTNPANSPASFDPSSAVSFDEPEASPMPDLEMAPEEPDVDVPEELWQSEDDSETLDFQAMVKQPEALVLIVFAIALYIWQLYTALIDAAAPEGSVSGRELAQRLGVNQSTISRRKTDDDFVNWTASLDPDGIAWSYAQGAFVPQIPEFDAQ